MRNPPGEIDRAIDWINHPALHGLRITNNTFLAENCYLRIRLAKYSLN